MMHVGFKEKKGVWDEDRVVVIVAEEANLRKKKLHVWDIIIYVQSQSSQKPVSRIRTIP